jgi:hypothetical protein
MLRVYLESDKVLTFDYNGNKVSTAVKPDVIADNNDVSVFFDSGVTKYERKLNFADFDVDGVIYSNASDVVVAIADLCAGFKTGGGDGTGSQDGVTITQVNNAVSSHNTSPTAHAALFDGKVDRPTTTSSKIRVCTFQPHNITERLIYASPSEEANAFPMYNAQAQLSTNPPTEDNHAANKEYVDNSIADKLDKNQGTANEGKILGIDSSGFVVPVNAPSGGQITNKTIETTTNTITLVDKYDIISIKATGINNLTLRIEDGFLDEIGVVHIIIKNNTGNNLNVFTNNIGTQASILGGNIIIPSTKFAEMSFLTFDIDNNNISYTLIKSDIF